MTTRERKHLVQVQVVSFLLLLTHLSADVTHFINTLFSKGWWGENTRVSDRLSQESLLSWRQSVALEKQRLVGGAAARRGPARRRFNLRTGVVCVHVQAWTNQFDRGCSELPSAPRRFEAAERERWTWLAGGRRQRAAAVCLWRWRLIKWHQWWFLLLIHFEAPGPDTCFSPHTLVPVPTCHSECF